MIPVFNGGAHLGEALASVLSQAPEPRQMQIAVVDDASTDIDVRELVGQAAGTRIEYHRHTENIGSVRNVNACIELARGRYVHVLHADDRVLAGYYVEIGRLFDRFPQAGACFCRVSYIDALGALTGVETTDAASAGLLPQWLQTIALGPRIQYVSLAVKRSVYESLGGYFGVSYAEDWEMHVRIASRFPMAYTPAVLAEYRQHADTISRRRIHAGGNLDDMAWVIHTINGYLPVGERSRLRSLAIRRCVEFGLHCARQVWHDEHNRVIAERQLDAVLRLLDDPETRSAVRQVRREIIGEPEVRTRP